MSRMISIQVDSNLDANLRQLNERLESNGEEIITHPVEIDSSEYQRLISTDTLEATIYKSIVEMFNNPELHSSSIDSPFNAAVEPLKSTLTSFMPDKELR